jgi:hypothetical protein
MKVSLQAAAHALLDDSVRWNEWSLQILSTRENSLADPGKMDGVLLELTHTVFSIIQAYNQSTFPVCFILKSRVSTLYAIALIAAIKSGRTTLMLNCVVCF